MLTDQQKALIAEAKDFTHSGNLIATHAWTLIDKLVAALEASDQPPQCDGFQYALGDGHKKCNICGTITAHFGRHDKGDKSQPPQLSESDEELLREARDGGREFRATQADWELWIVDLKNRLALRVEQLAAERDHLWELNELGKRCVSEGALAVELLLKLLEEAPSSEPPS